MLEKRCYYIVNIEKDRYIKRFKTVGKERVLGFNLQ